MADYIDLVLSDTNSKEDNVVYDPLFLFLQEVEIGMQLAPGEIWGIFTAVNLERYVFNRYVSLTQIRNEIQNYIANNCQHVIDFQYTISAEMLNIENKELLYIVMKLTLPTEYGDTEEIFKKFLLGK